jgi:hypothetical protein
MRLHPERITAPRMSCEAKSAHKTRHTAERRAGPGVIRAAVDDTASHIHQAPKLRNLESSKE